ncbi:MAG: 3-hydroxyacyl-CoA dehydrogenase family protein [Betaproteobacteria bacterium]|nr:3-hydroxyacyl-CoA dehydrogenase family protein [Betaproteobacteria bacterium]MDH3437363.1 3-hydroxyacyl-CoA dehydrogenase family protein [Betaproteobacteria bacterium]
MPAQQNHAAIIGGGIMGGDIAIIFAAGGWNVHVMSPSQKTRDALPARIAAGLKKLGAPEVNATLVKAYAKLEELPLKEVSLVVEAAIEDLALKHQIFADLERLARPDAILVSNTSTFPIGEIGKHLKTRSRVAGMHYFMPAHLVPLVEIVSAEFTDRKVAERLIDLMREFGKAPIDVSKDVPGFVGNRLQHALMREALWLVANGVTTPEGIDTAVRFGFGFRYIACGPMMQKELSGWDTNLLGGTSIYPHLYNEKAPPPMIRDMVAKGHIGMKAKHGFWQWTDETIAREKARIERCLQAGMEILKSG